MSTRIAASTITQMALSRQLQTKPRLQSSAAVFLHRQTCPSVFNARPLSYSSRLTYPRKDSQDKDSINTEATEYSKSATDDEGARQSDAAFNPSVTQPQEEMDLAGKNKGDVNNPLDVSPANPEVSKPRGESEGGAQNSSASSGNSTSARQRSSGGGSPKKGSTVA